MLKVKGTKIKIKEGKVLWVSDGVLQFGSRKVPLPSTAKDGNILQISGRQKNDAFTLEAVASLPLVAMDLFSKLFF